MLNFKTYIQEAKLTQALEIKVDYTSTFPKGSLKRTEAEELKKEWDEIAAMRKAGYSNQKIASILDTSIQMISIKIERMKSNGYQINPYGYMKDRDYSMEQDQETIENKDNN